MSFRIYGSHIKTAVIQEGTSNVVVDGNVSYTITENMVTMQIKEHTFTKPTGSSTHEFVTVPLEFLPNELTFSFVGYYDDNIFVGNFSGGTFTLDFDVNDADTSFTEGTIKAQTVVWTLHDFIG